MLLVLSTNTVLLALFLIIVSCDYNSITSVSCVFSGRVVEQQDLFQKIYMTCKTMNN